MAEKGGVRSLAAVLVLVLVMVMFTGHATATFRSCFEPCIIGCFVGASGGQKIPCAINCLAKCILGNGTTSSIAVQDCNFRCSVQQCATFGDDVDKVESCVDNCSNNFCNT